jgi:hypothetical protein
MQKIVADKKEAAGAAGGSTAPPALSLKKPSELSRAATLTRRSHLLGGVSKGERRPAARRLGLGCRNSLAVGMCRTWTRSQQRSRRSIQQRSALKIARPTFFLEA